MKPGIVHEPHRDDSRHGFMGAAVALLLWLAPVTLGVLPALADDWITPLQIFSVLPIWQSWEIEGIFTGKRNFSQLFGMKRLLFPREVMELFPYFVLGTRRRALP